MLTASRIFHAILREDIGLKCLNAKLVDPGRCMNPVEENKFLVSKLGPEQCSQLHLSKGSGPLAGWVLCMQLETGSEKPRLGGCIAHRSGEGNHCVPEVHCATLHARP